MNKIKQKDVRNIAIIAHVDHGKTTLVDYLLKQSNTFEQHQSEMNQSTIMDSNELERERGVTISSKNTAIIWEGHKINILDTPGHADFAGEVERVLNMADGCILLVDSAEGVLSQTRFVLTLALKNKMKTIVLINKIDRKDQRADEIVEEINDLFLDIAEEEDQLDFPILYAIARDGIAGKKVDLCENGSLMISDSQDLTPLFDTIIKTIPIPECNLEQPFQMQVTTLSHDQHKGKLAIGRIHRGKIHLNQPLAIVRNDKKIAQGRADYIFDFLGLGKNEIQESFCGEIIAIAGLKNLKIGDTITDLEHPNGLPALEISEPTMKIMLSVSTSPFVGKDGEYSTSRQLGNRLKREMETNVSLKIENGPTGDSYYISGRGEMHLSVLIETMRREGYEFSVARPEVIFKNKNGEIQEPWEILSIEVPNQYAGYIINAMGERKADMQDMKEIKDTTFFKYHIPTRNLIGFRSELLTQTSGMGIMHTQILGYMKKGPELVNNRSGALISMETGSALAYSLDNIQKRGTLFIAPTDEVYRGMIIGQNMKNEDMYVNPCKGKKLTNMRASASDAAIKLAPPTRMSLEQSLTWIRNDELLEVTPNHLRLRKRDLNFKR